MATLREYFSKFGGGSFSLSEQWTLRNSDARAFGEVTARLHLDFVSMAKYVSFYVPDMPRADRPSLRAVLKIDEILNWSNTHFGMVARPSVTEAIDANDLRFTGAVYIFSDYEVSAEEKEQLDSYTKDRNFRLFFRGPKFALEQDRLVKPQAFISHDSRDKIDIAEPLAISLQSSLCPVWYDQFTLKVGDSLREQIERGLKECPKCILILTPNFLSNKGWTKLEYDSIFTRELVEKKNVILPVWHNVSAEDVFKFSPVLADRFALNWADGHESVAKRLAAAINYPRDN